MTPQALRRIPCAAGATPICRAIRLPNQRKLRSHIQHHNRRPCERRLDQFSAKAASSSPAVPSGATDSTSQEAYDVYVYETKPLEEGESKHTLSVFVADESGIINRVAGVFARRGANIESLAVGLNIDKALFTIVVAGTASTVNNLVKQISKLVKVRYVENITNCSRIERELMLIKLRAPAGPARTEVLQLTTVFRARVVDISDRSMTVSVTGDPGKTLAFQSMMAKFGIEEVVRTGKISLKRGEDLLEMGGWGDSIRRKGLEKQRQANLTPPADDSSPPENDLDADVYSAEGDGAGVWEVENILDAVYDKDSQYEPYTLCIEVDNSPGVLNQVTGVFARRGYNVQSLAVGPAERDGMSRISMVVPGDGPSISKLIKQLNKLVAVQMVTDITGVPFVSRELMLIKVRCSVTQRVELRNLADVFRGSICDVSPNTATIQVEGKEDKMKALFSVLEEYGILEVARTGKIAVPRESGVNTRYLETRQLAKVF
ncbi:hypothetical protein BSKO_01471 [Bryopsis sp. KO-2023]|nr:hypothetical protein BSKO_01471 [Bryopsis sp. KO-2023]